MPVAPSEERVGLPTQRIVIELLHLPATIVLAFGLLGCHIKTKIFAEVGCNTLVMACGTVVEFQRQSRQRVTLGLGYVASLLHLRENDITTSASLFGTCTWIVERRVLAHAHKHGSLFNCQLACMLAEIDSGSTCKTHGVVAEVVLIEVHCKYLVLCILLFKVHRNDPLVGFLIDTIEHATRCTRIEQLGKLLSDGTATARILLLKDDTLYNDTEQRLAVDTRMVIEPHILGSHESLNKMRGDIIELHTHTVLLAVGPCSHLLAVGRDDL